MANAQTPSAAISVPASAVMPQSILTQMAVNMQNAGSGLGPSTFAFNNGSGGIGSAANASLMVLTSTSSGLAMNLNVSTGTSPQANLSIGVITLASALANKPVVLIEPANQAAAALTNGGAFVPYQGVTTSSFQINNCGGALAATTQYSWNIAIHG